jgi:glycosyltransferase involved in cell wall biosynthesis
MKIAYIVNARIPTEKAHGYQIMKVCEELSKAGASVRLIAPQRRNAIASDPFEYYSLKPLFSLERARSFDALAFERIFGAKISFILQKASFLRALSKMPIGKDEIVFTRDPEVAWFYSRKGYRVAYNAHRFPETKADLFLKLIRRVEKIVCNSKGTAEEFAKRGFMNILSLRNGVDPEAFQEVTESKAELRKKLFLSHGRLALYAGHLYPWKGVDTVVETAALLSDVNFVAVGGTQEDIEKYKRIVESRGLTNIQFIGYKEKGEMPRYLKAADVLLLPNIPSTKESQFYTSPIKMFEYMASGNPIVASDLPSLREVLTEKNSILVAPGNAAALSSGISEALDPLRGERLGETAQKDVLEYSWSTHAKKLLEFLGS